MFTDVQGRGIQVGKFVGNPIVIALSVTSANAQLLPNTHYRIWGSVDCFFNFGPDNTTTASTTSHPATNKLDYLHHTDGTNFWIAGVVSSGTGSLFVSQIDTSGT